MNIIFLLKQIFGHKGCVVIASTEEEARQLAYERDSEEMDISVWTSRQQTRCLVLGKSNKGVNAGIVGYTDNVLLR